MIVGMVRAKTNVISAFSEDQVECLTGVSRRQLRYWDRTDFFKPAFAGEDRRTPYSRIYSFKDVTSLRVLNVLRNQFSVSLQHLRDVRKRLALLSDEKWTAVQLFVLNKRVVFVEPGSRQHREIVSGQYVIGIPLSVVVSDTKQDIANLYKRDQSQIGKFERARYINHNALVIAGTRIPVAAIKRFAEDGYSVDQIMREYPTLKRGDIIAAIGHKGGGIAA